MALLSFKWLVPVLVSLFHPFYIAVTEVNHNAKEKTLEISCKVFAEDLEETLKKNYKTTVDLSAEKQHAQNDKLIADYIIKHLFITTDGKPAKLSYVGFEKQAEAVYCYFEAVNVAAPKKVDFTNTILQDFTDKQINIIHMIVGGNRKSQKLDYPEKQVSFSF
ncbi:MAG: hypothetical protein JWP88_984 [Flaviaesturariibacter sp.]|nr:hypothetical protein [Flaviaesturariibacter sp.]